jgi:heterodisulfide reductase subunit B
MESKKLKKCSKCFEEKEETDEFFSQRKQRNGTVVFVNDCIVCHLNLEHDTRIKNDGNNNIR